jgi:hypothetical protein
MVTDEDRPMIVKAENNYVIISHDLMMKGNLDCLREEVKFSFILTATTQIQGGQELSATFPIIINCDKVT